MSSIVLDLQKDMINSDYKVSDLLRKAYIIARKLKVKDFETWIYNELNGYKQVLKIPLYRVKTGEIRWWNPYYGWMPAIIPDIKLHEKLTKHTNRQGIPELETIAGENSKQGIFYESLPDSYSELFGYNTKYILELNLIHLNSIIVTVKNIILEWSLKLEEDGIMGEDMNFTEVEKEKAGKYNYTVNNFYGEVSGQIQQNTTSSTQVQTIDRTDTGKINEIITLLKENNLEMGAVDKKRLDTAVETVSNEMKQPSPGINIIKESFKTIRNVLEGIAGSIIASGILDKIAQLPFFK